MRAFAGAAIVLAACAGTRPAPAGGGERMVRIDGLRVSDGGAGGVPVVFHHGLGSDLEVWRDQLDHLRGSRRAVAYDARGHGESDRAADGVYTVEKLADDLDGVVRALGIDRFWLVGHSMAGSVVSTYAGKHPDKLAGIVYVDAVGDLSGSPRAREYFRTHDADMTPEKLQAAFSEMLGPKARPRTRQIVLDAVARLDPRAFPALRVSMAEVPAARLLARFDGPKFAIEEASGDMLSLAASKLPGVQRRSVADVSHWLMLDDPVAVNALLDEMLASARGASALR